MIDFAYASIVSIKNIKKGEIFSYENIWVKRPGNGELLSDKFDKVLGTKACRDIKKDNQISFQDIEKSIDL